MRLPAILTRPPQRIGRRGAILAVLGTLWVLIGISVIAASYNPTPALLNTAHDLRGAIWIGTGFVAVAWAVKPQGRDWPGFVALYIMVAYRAVAYCADWASGNPAAVVGFLVWVAVAVLIYTIAGWQEPADEDLSSNPRHEQ